MIEKVNPSHPDKIADRIAGAIVDLGYKIQKQPKIAVEVLIGHDECKIIIESSVTFNEEDLFEIVYRIVGTRNMLINITSTKQDEILAKNQKNEMRCGDNGIFKGVPLSNTEREISKIARQIYENFPSDGKYILTNDKLIVCQSQATEEEIKNILETAKETRINPLGYWSGGINVDTGATNRKLGSDMARGVTGGGLHGKDLSKADVSVNIYAFLKAQDAGEVVEFYCAIGDTEIDGKPYSEIVNIAEQYIKSIGGFEKLAEWGLF